MLDINPTNTSDQGRPNTFHDISVPSNPQPQHAPGDMPGGLHNNEPHHSESLEFLAKEQDNSKMLFTFTIVIAVIVVLVMGYLYYLKSVKNQELATSQKTQEDLTVQLSEPTLAKIEATATRYSGGLKSLNALFVTDVKYSKVLSAFEKLTPGEVVMQSMSIDPKYQLKLSAKANTLDESAKFVKALKSAPFIKDLNLDGDTQNTAAGDKSYLVSISATILPEVLTKEVANAGN